MADTKVIGYVDFNGQYCEQELELIEPEFQVAVPRGIPTKHQEKKLYVLPDGTYRVLVFPSLVDKAEAIGAGELIFPRAQQPTREWLTTRKYEQTLVETILVRNLESFRRTDSVNSTSLTSQVSPDDGYVTKKQLDTIIEPYVSFKTIQNKNPGLEADRTGSHNQSLYVYSKIRPLYLAHDDRLSEILPATYSEFQEILRNVQPGQ